MTAVATQQLTEARARKLTDEVRQDAERLWEKLLELYEGEAHIALGYASWGAYFEREFGRSGRYGELLVQAARVAETLGSTNKSSLTESHARELAPLLDHPRELRAAWKEARDEHGEPTAAEVREVVQRRRDVLVPKTQEQLDRQLRWATTVNVLDGLAHFDRRVSVRQAEREVALFDDDVMARRGDRITVARLRRAAEWATCLADALERRGK